MPADRSEVVIIKQEPVTTTSLKKYVCFDVTMSTNDTVTIADLSSIDSASLVNLTDGLEDTCTIATNVVTLTQSGITNVRYVGLAVGS